MEQKAARGPSTTACCQCVFMLALMTVMSVTIVMEYHDNGYGQLYTKASKVTLSLPIGESEESAVQSWSEVVQIGVTTVGVMLDPRRRRVVVLNYYNILLIHDYYGMLVGTLEVKTCTSSNWCLLSLAMDTTRGLYLLTCRDQLVIVDPSSMAEGSVHIPGVPYAVTFLAEDDLYAVSEMSGHSVIVVDAATRKVTRRFGTSTTNILGDGYIDRPLFLSSTSTYSQHGGILVSDAGQQKVKLFTTNGTFVRSYGGRGSGPGELLEPRGVVADTHGRIFVCDAGNNRVAVYWSGESRDVSTVVMTTEHLAGYPPQYIDYDSVTGHLVVATYRNLHIFKPG